MHENHSAPLQDGQRHANDNAGCGTGEQETDKVIDSLVAIDESIDADEFKVVTICNFFRL